MSDRIRRLFIALFFLAIPAFAAAQTLTRFDIPKGPLTKALAAFEAATGSRVTVADSITLDGFASPGVAKTCTAREALESLVAGTGFTVRSVGAEFTLRIAVAPMRVDVTGALAPYRAVDSSGATKTMTPLRDIPQTINVVPAELLRDQRAQSVADAVRNVPGVSVAQGEGNRDQVVIRGISTASDFFVNGIRDDQERFRDLYNVQSIEVIQGPAAVLFGRGGAGGVVNAVTIQPVRGTRSEAVVEAGAYDHKRTTLQVGLPVGASGAFRMAAMGESSGGFRDGFFLRRYAFNPTLGLRLGSRASLTLGVEHLSDHRLADRGIPSRAGAPVDVPVSQLFGSRSQNDAHSGVDSGRATFEFRVTDALVVRNNLLVGRYDKSYQNVFPGSAVSGAGTFTLSAYNHDIDRVNTFNQTDVVYETRLFGMQHTILGGAEVGHQFQDELRHTATNILSVPLSASERDANFATAPLAVDRHAAANVFAGYAQDQLALSERWKAVAGMRVDRFSVRVDDHLPGSVDLARTDSAISPRAGVIYQPTGAASIYASYSYTFLPSGQTLGLARNTAELRPENAENYEAGAKLDLLRRRLTVSTALFRLDRNNVKNIDPNDPTRLLLTGQQRTEGFLVSAAGNIDRRWKISGGYANFFARVTQDTASAPAGRRVGLVPRHQVTLWSTYDVTSRWIAGGGLNAQSRAYTSFTNAVTLPSFVRVDGLVAYRMGRYRLQMNAENLFDTRYYPTANGDNNISPGSPRNVQLSLRASF
jgi:catecholate siderophore receptor